MKNYALCAIVATLGFLAPTASLYAQPSETPAVADLDAGEAVAAHPEATAPPEAVTSDSAPAEENGATVEAHSEPIEADITIGTAIQIKEAVQGGDWGLAVLLVLMLLVSLLRWGAGKFEFLAFFKGKIGGYALVFAASTGGMLLTVLGAGGALTFGSVSEAAVFGFGAIGGWETWKDIRSAKKTDVQPSA